MPHRDLNVLDAANRAADLINELIDRSPPGRLLHVCQLRHAVQSIVANIKRPSGAEQVAIAKMLTGLLNH